MARNSQFAAVDKLLEQCIHDALNHTKASEFPVKAALEKHPQYTVPEALLEQFEPNERAWLLHQACCSHHDVLMQQLLAAEQSGLDCGLKHSMNSAEPAMRRALLASLVEHGYMEILDVIAAYAGSGFFATRRGGFPAFVAALRHSRLDAVRLLLAHGAAGDAHTPRAGAVIPIILI